MLTFGEALTRSAEIHNKRHAFLGNGFSIACRPDCFTYGRLLDEADFSELSVDGPALFAAEDTTDFEEIINSLRAAARMVSFYESSDPELAARLLEDAERIKAALANTLARNHPDNVGEIELEEYVHARRFLLNFGHIFTVNYDLLLYWTLMQEMEPEIKSDDGSAKITRNQTPSGLAGTPILAGDITKTSTSYMGVCICLKRVPC